MLVIPVLPIVLLAPKLIELLNVLNVPLYSQFTQIILAQLVINLPFVANVIPPLHLNVPYVLMDLLMILTPSMPKSVLVNVVPEPI